MRITFRSCCVSSAVALAAVTTLPLSAQNRPARVYTRADTLRGSWETPGRSWWDVTFYDLHVRVNPADSTIAGYNRITYRVVAGAATPGRELQLDLIPPLAIDSVVQDGRKLEFRQDGAAWFVTMAAPQQQGRSRTLTAYYHGRPTVARRPPWDGGFTWAADSLGRPWVVTTDQGIGASVWWPNKDTQAEEPDSQRIAITVPQPLTNVSNGRLRSRTDNPDGTTTWEWFVANPINNYAIALAAGGYAHWSEEYQGEKGKLTMDFWPLTYHEEAARRQWVQARSMMQCFEHWFGPYPWYEDGYKLIEVSNNGMEHQSAVSYGNGFANGYRGRDGSGTGYGMKWDFIIVHESAHEWFANNITAKDQADMWVHEAFGNYAEGLYTECQFGKEAGAAYVIGTRRGIRNDRRIEPAERGVNAQGSGDMYPKGGNLLHTIRQLVNDDERWRGILRGLNQTFWHQTVIGTQIEDYISHESGIDLSRVFEQYLRTTMIPALEYRIAGTELSYRWSNVVPGFDMPVRVTTSAGQTRVLKPTAEWQQLTVTGLDPTTFLVDANYYVVPKRVE
ncbi:MAG: M1 family metallopeptidase [Gemmatimonadetes bacterium]|nr:M1 family metallopeptidase [Gemmatimonadota bacterium]